MTLGFGRLFDDDDDADDESNFSDDDGSGLWERSNASRWNRTFNPGASSLGDLSGRLSPGSSPKDVLAQPPAIGQYVLRQENGTFRPADFTQFSSDEGALQESPEVGNARSVDFASFTSDDENPSSRPGVPGGTVHTDFGQFTTDEEDNQGEMPIRQRPVNGFVPRQPINVSPPRSSALASMQPRKQRKRRSRSALKLQALVRAHFGLLAQVNVGDLDQASRYPVASEREVNIYLTSGKNPAFGPTLANFAYDRRRTQTPWNVTLSEIFAQNMRTHLAAQGTPLSVSVDDARLRKAFMTRLRGIRAGAFLSRPRNHRSLRARHTRKSSMIFRRHDAAEQWQHLDENLGDVVQLTRCLPPECHSDDESDHEDGYHKYFVKDPAWRNPRLGQVFQILDRLHIALRFRADGRISKGAWPHIRYYTDIRQEPEHGLAPSGLPINFYDEGYIARLSNWQLRRLNPQPAVSIKLSADLVREAYLYPLSSSSRLVGLMASHISASSLDNGSSCAFYHKAVLYVSPNSASACTPPLVRNDDYRFSKDKAYLQNFTQPEWWTLAYGWVAFVPIDFVFDGPFEPLQNIKPVSIYRGKTLQGYGLDEARLTAWKKIEEEMYQFLAILYQEFEHCLKPSLFPTAISSLHPERLHATAKAASRHLRRCQRWYSMWIGLMSFRIACVEVAVCLARPWYIALPALGMCPIFVAAVRGSIVCRFTQQKRVGTFLNPVPSNRSLAEWLILFQIPVWYPWSEADAKELAPNFWYPSTVPPQTASTTPPKNRISPTYEPQQNVIAQEPWKAHFSLHAAIHAKKEATETFEEREDRLKRAANPRTMINTGSKFIWKWTGADNLNFRRIRLTDEEAQVEVHGGSWCWDEMRYDAWCNEWDFCVYWGARYSTNPSEVFTVEPGDGDITDGNGLDRTDRTNHMEDPGQTKDEREENEEYILAHSVGPSLTTIVVPPVSKRESLEILPFDMCLRLHLGFSSPSPGSGTTLPNEHDWAEAIKALGRTSTTAMDQVAIGSPASILTFVSDLLNDSTFPLLCDLHPSNHRHISLTKFRSYFFQLGIYYILRASTFDDDYACGWNIAVSTSADALFVYRFLELRRRALRWELIETLVYEGIAFNTFTALNKSQRCSFKDVHIVIPIRLSGHIFTPADYTSYVALRAQILLSPRGRAALLHGGIVTRLALEVLDWEDAMSGPSNAVMCDGIGQTTCCEGIEYMDDSLTKDELDIICGLYHVYTGQGDQQTMLSWWPLSHTWQNRNANGFNIGYWSQRNEEWYLKRLEDIECQHPKRGVPMNTTEWRSYLKGTKASRTARNAVDKMSTRFLA
ncbi:hypothetical protein CVT24_010227 [Panaeolus cyanescens]|uniref:Uncharacterized protein n=1 Tax=Panaeolus cyanescens TaxID=181874 RepID=A0A409YPS3_9AGAR|nr:hypothetical protein CVT24_010227 [Panaeolus cyanescens]